MTDHNKAWQERTEEIARRLAAAYISYNLGIKPDYCRKVYLSDNKEIGAMWIVLAIKADEMCAAADQDRYKKLHPGKIQ